MIQPTGIVSQEAFGSVLVKAVYYIVPNGIASAEAFGVPLLKIKMAPVLMRGECYIQMLSDGRVTILPISGGSVYVQQVSEGEVRIK